MEPESRCNIKLSYSIKDNYGSIATSENMGINSCYPFGLKHKGYNNNKLSEFNYKTYQGQENTLDLGLNIHEWKYRISDPAIGRFWQIDPLADKYQYNSTYAFQENKIGMGVELEGLEVHEVRSGSKNILAGTTRQINESININRTKRINSNDSYISNQAQEERNVEVNGAKRQVMSGATEAGVGSIYLAGEGLQDLGSAMELTGLAASTSTVGASLILVPFGAGISGVGTLFKMGANYIKGDTDENIKEGSMAVIGGMTGGLADEALDATKAVSKLTKSEELTQESIYQLISKLWDYGAEKVVNETVGQSNEENNTNNGQ